MIPYVHTDYDNWLDTIISLSYVVLIMKSSTYANNMYAFMMEEYYCIVPNIVQSIFPKNIFKNQNYTCYVLHAQKNWKTFFGGKI